MLSKLRIICLLLLLNCNKGIITNPTDENSITINEISVLIEGYGRRIKVVDGFAFVVGLDDGLQIIDLQNPSNPTLIGSLETHWASSVEVFNEFLFLTDCSEGLKIIDISNLSSPKTIFTLDTPDWAENVFYYDSTLYVSDRKTGVIIYEFNSIDTLKEISVISTPGLACDFAIKDSIGYVADSYSGFRIINIKDKNYPYEVNFIKTKHAWEVEVIDNFLYVADDSNGTYIYDISNPINPLLIRTIAFNSQNVKIHGDFICICNNGNKQVGLFSIQNNNLNATFNTDGNPWQAVMNDSLIYLANGGLGFSILKYNIE